MKSIMLMKQKGVLILIPKTKRRTIISNVCPLAYRVIAQYKTYFRKDNHSSSIVIVVWFSYQSAIIDIVVAETKNWKSFLLFPDRTHNPCSRNTYYILCGKDLKSSSSLNYL